MTLSSHKENNKIPGKREIKGDKKNDFGNVKNRTIK